MRSCTITALAPLVGLSVAVAGCGTGVEAGPAPGMRGVAAASSAAEVGQVPEGGDPVLARLMALAARRSGSAGGPSRHERTSSSGIQRLAGLLPPMRNASGSVPAAAPPRWKAGAGFVLGAGDELDLVTSGQPEFSGAVTVRADGTVVLPTTGDLVRAGSRSVEEFAAAVADAVSPRYVKKRPEVSVTVRRSPRLTYHVFGAVRTGGRYEIPPGGISVLDAVIRASRTSGTKEGEAGGRVLDFESVRGARYNRVHVIGPKEGASTVRVVDVASAMRGGPAAREAVSPGDVIVVPTAGGQWSEKQLRRQISRGSGPFSGRGRKGAP